MALRNYWLSTQQLENSPSGNQLAAVAVHLPTKKVIYFSQQDDAATCRSNWPDAILNGQFDETEVVLVKDFTGRPRQDQKIRDNLAVIEEALGHPLYPALEAKR